MHRQEITMVSPAEGRVTATACEPNVPVLSGASTVTVDGSVILNLATSTPLWRDLSLGDRGVDVDALNAELNRLGYDLSRSRSVTRATRRALSDLFDRAGDSKEVTTVLQSRILWIPDATV